MKWFKTISDLWKEYEEKENIIETENEKNEEESDQSITEIKRDNTRSYPRNFTIAELKALKEKEKQTFHKNFWEREQFTKVYDTKRINRINRYNKKHPKKKFVTDVNPDYY